MLEENNLILVNGKKWDPLAKIAETLGLDPRDYLTMPIKKMNLNHRALNCLERSRLESIGELIDRSPDELMRLRNLGQLSLHNILDECDRLLSGENKKELESSKRRFGGHSNAKLLMLNDIVCRVISSMKTNANEEKQEEVLERLLFVISDDSLWKKSKIDYTYALKLLVQSKSDFYFWNGIVSEDIKTMRLSTVVHAFYIITGESPELNVVNSDETVGSINTKKFLDYYDGDYWRRLYRWICTPISEVEKDIYHNSLSEREKYVLCNRIRGVSYKKIGQEIGVATEKIRQIAAGTTKKVLYWLRVTGYVGYLYAYTGEVVITLKDACKVVDNMVAKAVWYSLAKSKDTDAINSRFSFSNKNKSIRICLSI